MVVNFRLVFFFWVAILISPLFAQLSVVGQPSFSSYTLSRSSGLSSGDSIIDSDASPLAVLAMNYAVVMSDTTESGSGGGSVSPILPEVSVSSATLIGKPLFYPTPFRLREGSTLGFELGANMPIELRFYTMRGQEVFRQSYPAGIPDRSALGYNKIPITPSVLGTSSLSSGIYFFLILSDEAVIGKGRFALTP